MKSLVLLALLFFPLCNPRAQAASADDAVQAQVRDFYHWYIHELNKGGNTEPMKLPAIHRYISTHFLREIARMSKHSDMDGGGLDYDPFIMAQDWDKGWESNIRIKDLKQAGSKWTMQVELSGKEMAAHRLNLVVVEESGVWKIDRVSEGDTR